VTRAGGLDANAVTFLDLLVRPWVIETFPFPCPTSVQAEIVAAAARALDSFRRGWLDPEGVSPLYLRGRTLTNLYNQTPTWLVQAHDRLDRAVFAAYG